MCLPVWDVLPGSIVSELLGQAVINEEKFVTVPADSHQEIVWLDVSVDEVLIMYEFYNRNKGN